MKILVTGGAGYIGSELVPQLLNEKFEVTVIDNLLYGVDGLIPCFPNKNFTLKNEDIYNSDFIKNNISNFDFIIHLAAIVGYPACKKNPSLANITNFEATKKIFNLAQVSNIPFIFASTNSNYGHVKNGHCTEDTPLSPVSIYGETKTNSEKIISCGTNFLILRFATAFGISNRMRLDLLINDFVFQAIKNKNLTVYEKNFKRSFIHVRDISQNIIFSLKNFSKLKNNIFNLGNEELNLSKKNIVEFLKTKIDFYLHFAEFEKDEDMRNYKIDYTKSKKAGFKSCTNLSQGVDELIEVCKNIKKISQYSNI